MKKKLFVFILITIILGGTLFIFNNKFYKNKSIENIQIKKAKNYEKMLSMMLETGNKTGKYTETTASKWPTTGYIFNATLSKCENGGEVSWDDTKKTVIMTGNSSDKCYVYFDKFSLLTVNSINITSDYNSINATIRINEGYYDASKYYFKINNGNYIETTSKSYIFSNLNPNTIYSIEVKVVDSEGNESLKSVETMTLTHTIMDTCSNGNNLTDCLMTFAKKYTIFETNIYYHNSTLANGAEDYSYRFAGTHSKLGSNLDNIDNFVCINSDEDPCSLDNLYRILGIYDKYNTGSGVYYLKLIKYSYISNEILGTDGAFTTISDVDNDYSYYYQKINNYLPVVYFDWNNDTKTNLWEESNLNLINLNTNFINNISQYNYIDQMIVNYSWIVGGNSYDSLLNSKPAGVFKNEVINSKNVFEARIGLMYASDFLYAVDPSSWTNSSSTYNNSLNSWLYMGINEFTITKISDTTDQVVRINKDGHLENFGVYRAEPNSVRPVFVLSENVRYITGDGTYTNPIRISI